MIIERSGFRLPLATFATLGLLVLAVALAGCRESEQNRPLHYDKGVYGGKADSEVGADTRSELRMRHRGQSFGL